MKFVSAAHLTGGGTISGDLTITGDLSVQGGGSFTYDEMLTGNMQITSTGDTTLTIKGAGNRGDANTPRGHLHFIRDTVHAEGATEANDVAGIVQVSSTDASGNDGLITEINYLTSTATAGAVVSDIVWKTVHGAGIGTRTEAMRIQGDNVGIGTAAPAARIHLVGGNMLLADGEADNAVKQGRIGSEHYDVDEEPFFYLYSINQSDNNQINIGGGTSAGNAATNIKFYTAANITTTTGTARMVIDNNSRISLSNNDSGTSNTVFGKSVGAIDSGTNYNVFIGEEVAGENTLADATQNTMVGYRAGHSLTSGGSNTIMGRQGGLEIQDGHNNTLIGNNAGASTVLGGYLVAIGDGAMMSGAVTAAADGMIAIGASALAAQISGAGNLAIGQNALTLATAGATNLAIGLSALGTINHANSGSNIAIGAYAMDGVSTIDGTSANIMIGVHTGGGSWTGTASTHNVAVGGYALFGALNGSVGQIAIGYEALKSSTTGVGNTAVGYLAATDITTGIGNTVVGYEALTNAQTAVSYSTAIGWRAGYKLGDDAGSDHSSHNTVVGYAALGGGDDTVANNIARYNTAIGYQTLGGGTHGSDGTAITATHCVAVGYAAMGAWTAGVNSVAIGNGALDGVTTGACDDNVAIGKDAMGGAIAAEVVDDCVAIGSGALSGALDSTDGVDEASGTVAIGKSALAALTSGSGNTALGYTALSSVTIANNNTALGYDALGDAGVGEVGNTAIGYNAMSLMDEGNGSNIDYNIAIGFEALKGHDKGTDAGAITDNVAIGYRALGHANFASSTSPQVGTIGIGTSALGALTTGLYNTAVGYTALQGHTTGAANTAIGHGAMAGTTGAVNDAPHSASNTAVGAGAMGGDWHDDTTCNYNTAIGAGALDAALEDCEENTAIGYNALTALVGGQSSTNGELNTALGANAGDALTTGTKCTIIGATSDASAVGASNQTVIGYGTTGQADNSVVLGNADTTYVFAGQDEGATVLCAGIRFDETGEVLDDYEEGTYTITCTCATSGTVTIGSAGNELQYTKIGRVVHIQGKIILDSISSPVGNLQWSLPFASINGADESGMAAGAVIPYNLNVESGMTSLGCATAEGVSYFYMMESGDDSVWDIIEGSDVDGNEILDVGLTYVT
jgi:hypothetical protein